MQLLELTDDAVQVALRQYEKLFAAGDVDGILQGFADDVRVHYGSNPPFAGKDALRDLLLRRFSTMRDYQLCKKLEFIRDSRIASSWTGSWIDTASHVRIEVFGIEILRVRDGLFAEWSAAVSTWPSKRLEQ
jgi:nuclear transport factor 2 (NTF2) superfamily protein